MGLVSFGPMRTENLIYVFLRLSVVLYLAAVQSNWQNLRWTDVTGLQLIGGAVESDFRRNSDLRTQVLREVPLRRKIWIQPCFFFCVLVCFCFCTLNSSSVNIICYGFCSFMIHSNLKFGSRTLRAATRGRFVLYHCKFLSPAELAF